VAIYAALAGTTPAAVLGTYGGAQFSTFKTALADLTVDKIGPVASEMKRLVADPGHIDRVLAEGAARARAIAEPVMRSVRDIVGFIQSR
jgi:tryptophanyl-tRNA synthetase